MNPQGAHEDPQGAREGFLRGCKEFLRKWEAKNTNGRIRKS